MKALTIRQPWASLIAAGVKTIETRSWSTKHRGPIAIHAGTVNPPDGMAVGRWSVYRQVDGARALDTAGNWHELPLGAVVAVVGVVDCVPMVGTSEDRPPSAFVCDYEQDGDGELPHQRGGLWLIGDNALTYGTPTRVEDQRPFGDFAHGRYAWLLDNVVGVRPAIPAKGRQGLWNWEPVG